MRDAAEVKTQSDNLCVLHALENLTGIKVKQMFKYIPDERKEIVKEQGCSISEATAIITHLTSSALLLIDLECFQPLDKEQYIKMILRKFEHCLLFGARTSNNEYHCLAYKNGKYLEAHGVEINTLPIIIDGIGCLVPLTR